MARFRGGDAAALGEIYARFSHRIYRFLVRLAGRPDVAEDLHQETWIAAARHAPRLAADTDLAAWLFTVARNKHHSWRRSAAAEASRREAASAEAETAAVDQAVDARRDLERALASLPAIHREILVLIGCEGLETAQAAAVLGLTAEAVRQRLARARAALAAALAPAEDAGSRRVVAFRKEIS